ncbi:PREDICTED: phosphoinositide 3-kinase regulatory subunit 4-like [Amphimedon queenslandica]|uniref:Phosphatase 2A Regulatory Subunit A helical domain-containing protein n=2 Tax=Amphimedon queenslandica TaxID=400682 RepID=A0AAN0JJ06_AMPQE|nr:PREDICTED: phosphoinositide 3-kinase regulatory subunit 4-like [Amphimedon queenslandica]|eukprot:XP_019856954.1 PREDICTED: phosphoinositide 3-kinase regulatory subunit 4-like [Amphimedon queenslandica]
MTVLCINGLFNLRFLISSLQQIVPFIAHPNIWARYGSVGFIMAAASQLDDIDALCYIAPVVQPFLKYNNILELDNKLVLLNAISDPIPRSVLDCVMKQQDLDSLFEW